MSGGHRARTPVASNEPAETVAVDVERYVGVRATDPRLNHVRRHDVRLKRVVDD